MPTHDDIFESTDFAPENPNGSMPDKIVDPVSDSDQPEIPVEEISNSIPEGVDNPKSYKHFQQIAEKRLVETTQERILREQAEAKAKMLEEELNNIKNTPQPKIVKPQPPQKPTNYNPSDAINDPDSDSWKYREAKEQFDDEFLKYQDNFMSSIAEQRRLEDEQQQQAVNLAKLKADAISKLQLEGGLAPEEAIECFNWATTPDSTNPKIIAEFFKWQKTQKPVNTKVNNFNERIERRNQNPLPPGVGISSESPSKDTPDDAFNKQFNKKNQKSI